MALLNLSYCHEILNNISKYFECIKLASWFCKHFVEDYTTSDIYSLINLSKNY